MEHFYFLIGLGLLVSLAFVLSLRASLKRRLRRPYVADKTLFSPAQHAFMKVLERAIGKDYRVHGKVRALDVIGVLPRLSRRDQERAYERLGDRRFDFLICDRETTAILCAVNLSPRSRLRKQPSKNELDRICAAAGLPLVRFCESDFNSIVEIEERIFAAIRSRAITPKADKADEVLAEETISILRSLSRGIDAEGPSNPAAARQSPSDRPRARLSMTKRSPTIEPTPAPATTRAPRRREPMIQERPVPDDEPVFKIDLELDDEEPARARRP